MKIQVRTLLRVAAISLALAGLVISGVVFASDSSGRGPKFKAGLSGANEVPAVTTDTTGKARIDFNADLTAAKFSLTVKNGVRVTQAHIHCGPAGQNGPVVVFLAGFHDRGWDVDGKWISDASFTDANIVNTACGATLADLAQAMRDGQTYVNAHTLAHPAGEVRGQLEAGGGDD
jgi:hypothetical protein